MKFKSLWIAGVMLAAIMGLGQGQAAIIKSYDFDSGLSDTLGNGVDLVDSGGSVSGGRYDFSDNQGLRLDSALLDTSNYGIEFKVRVDDSVSGYNKLVDFESLGSDIGLYVFSGAIYFYDSGSVAGSVALGTDFTVGLERKAGIVSIFLDGGLIDSFADGLTFAVPSGNILNFFEDDTGTSTESFAGSVDFIRIHEDASTFGTAVPEPSTFVMVATGVIGMFVACRKRRETNLVS